ncbi:MAG: hypothetical protein ABI700_00730 [Chloroflexota bacterium]
MNDDTRLRATLRKLVHLHGDFDSATQTALKRTDLRPADHLVLFRLQQWHQTEWMILSTLLKEGVDPLATREQTDTMLEKFETVYTTLLKSLQPPDTDPKDDEGSA